MMASVTLRLNLWISDEFQVPIAIPVIVLIISIYLVIGPIIDDPKVEYLYATIFIFAGFLFYIPFVHYKYVMPGMGKLVVAMTTLSSAQLTRSVFSSLAAGWITTFLQLLLEVAPSSSVED